MDSKTLEYQDKAKGLLRAEIKRRNLNYDQLAEKLAAIGVKESARNLSNKMSRGASRRGSGPMPRSYWLPVVAVVGLIVAASASPNGHGANAEQAKAARNNQYL